MVTVYGSKDSAEWWTDPDGAKLVGNQLRDCHYVGFYMRWDNPTQKHVITAWGDELNEGNGDDITQNPQTVKVTDSDRSTDPPMGTGPDWEEYDYTWDNINDRWYVDYVAPGADPFLWNVVVLSPQDEECEGSGTRAMGSWTIVQDDFLDYANDLHYKAGTQESIRICWYDVSIDRPTVDIPRIVKYHTNDDPVHGWEEYIEVDREFPPPEWIDYGDDITITTEFLLPTGNSVKHWDTKFTRDGVEGAPKPEFGWDMFTPTVGMTTGGGFVYGAWEIYADPAGTELIGAYRAQHEYARNENPNQHTFTLESLEASADLYFGGFRFGHSCVHLSAAELWALVPGDFLQGDTTLYAIPAGGTHGVTINWGVAPCVPAASASFRNAGTNPASHVAKTLPELGEVYTAEIDLAGTTGHSLALLMGFFTPLTFPLSGGQTVLVNFADGYGELLGLQAMSGPVARYDLPVPVELMLLGLPAYTQAIHVGGVRPFALSNAQDLVCGY